MLTISRGESRSLVSLSLRACREREGEAWVEGSKQKLTEPSLSDSFDLAGVGLASAATSVIDGCFYFGEVDSDATKMRIRAAHIVTQAKTASHSGQVWVSSRLSYCIF